MEEVENAPLCGCYLWMDPKSKPQVNSLGVNICLWLLYLLPKFIPIDMSHFIFVLDFSSPRDGLVDVLNWSRFSPSPTTESGGLSSLAPVWCVTMAKNLTIGKKRIGSTWKTSDSLRPSQSAAAVGQIGMYGLVKLSSLLWVSQLQRPFDSAWAILQCWPDKSLLCGATESCEKTQPR